MKRVQREALSRFVERGFNGSAWARPSLGEGGDGQAHVRRWAVSSLSVIAQAPEQFDLAILDYGIMIIYFAGVLFHGWWVGRKGHEDSEGYFLAGKTLPWCLIGFSLYASNISGSSFVGLMGAAYNNGLAVFNFEWTATIVLIFFALFMLPVLPARRAVDHPRVPRDPLRQAIAVRVQCLHDHRDHLHRHGRGAVRGRARDHPGVRHRSLARGRGPDARRPAPSPTVQSASMISLDGSSATTPLRFAGLSVVPARHARSMPRNRIAPLLALARPAAASLISPSSPTHLQRDAQLLLR